MKKFRVYYTLTADYETAPLYREVDNFFDYTCETADQAEEYLQELWDGDDTKMWKNIGKTNDACGTTLEDYRVEEVSD